MSYKSLVELYRILTLPSSTPSLSQWRKLLVDMRQTLASAQYTQIPSLSSAHPINLDQPVVIRPATARRTKVIRSLLR